MIRRSVRSRSVSAHRATQVPAPLPARASASFPYPLTFFLTARQRKAVLRRLSPLGKSRAGALLKALRIRP